jgi:membrane protease YdiL (CAAX protease family)
MRAEPDFWKSFLILSAIGAIAVFLELPRPLNTVLLLFGILVLSVLIGLGLWLAKETNLNVFPTRPSDIGRAILSGAGLGIVIILIIQFFVSPFLPQILTRFISGAESPPWKRLIIAFDSAITEEIIFRLFLFSLLVWLANKVFKSNRTPLNNTVLWAINSMIALGFGLAHIPSWYSITQLNPIIVGVIIFLNSIGGLTFGYLYFKQGLASSMIAHFTADIVLHIIAVGAFLN